MAVTAKEREEIAKEIRAEIEREFKEVNEIVAEAFELARLEKELKNKLNNHMEKRDAILKKGNSQSEELKRQLSVASLGTETKKSVSGTRAMSNKRVSKEQKAAAFKLGFEAAKDVAVDGWIEQIELIEVLDGFLDGDYSSQGSIFWKEHLTPLKANPKNVKKDGVKILIKIK